MNIIKSESLLKKYINKYQLQNMFDEISRKYVEIHEFNPGEMIISEATELSYYYILVEGKAKVSPSSKKGQVVLLDFMKPIDIIGDIEYVLNHNNYHDVLALKKTILIAIPIDIIDKYFSKNVYFYKFISEIMAKKIMSTSQKFSQSMMYSLRVRFAMYLVEHYDEENNTVIKLKFKEVADYFGITPRHLRRIMVEFEESNILVRSIGEINIIDIDKLRLISEEEK